MTAGYTHDIDACVRDQQLAAARTSSAWRCRRRRDTEASTSSRQVNVPIVADVHFHFQRALEAVRNKIVLKMRSTGNINDRSQVIDGHQARCAGRGQCRIRVGVNEGSIIERATKQKRMKNSARSSATTSTGTCSRS